MPNHPRSNIVMICTGTGSAPMRAMTEWRRRQRNSGKFEGGKLMLFFGARTKEELPYFGPLQNLPKDRVPECGPGLDFMLQQFPMSQVFSLVLRGSGECAEAGWRLLGLTIPAWTLLWFIGLIVLSLVVGWRAGRRRDHGF
jgi:hypothetical protein